MSDEKDLADFQPFKTKEKPEGCTWLIRRAHVFNKDDHNICKDFVACNTAKVNNWARFVSRSEQNGSPKQKERPRTHTCSIDVRKLAEAAKKSY